MKGFKTFSMKKKIVTGAIAVGITLSMAGTALAYFTTTGNGTGNATVGSATSWTVGQTTTGTGSLYPDALIGGANVVTNAYTVKNPGTGSQSLTSVTIQVATSTGGVWSVQANTAFPACTAADFSINGGAVGSTATDISQAGTFIPGQSKTANVTIEMIDNNANQNNCEGVTVPLYYVAS